MMPEPFKSALSLGDVEDTSLALPSDHQLRSAQQRVLDQVCTIKRSKSKYSSKSVSGLASPTSEFIMSTLFYSILHSMLIAYQHAFYFPYKALLCYYHCIAYAEYGRLMSCFMVIYLCFFILLYCGGQMTEVCIKYCQWKLQMIFTVKSLVKYPCIDPVLMFTLTSKSLRAIDDIIYLLIYTRFVYCSHDS